VRIQVSVWVGVKFSVRVGVSVALGVSVGISLGCTLGTRLSVDWGAAYPWQRRRAGKPGKEQMAVGSAAAEPPGFPVAGQQQDGQEDENFEAHEHGL